MNVDFQFKLNKVEYLKRYKWLIIILSMIISLLISFTYEILIKMPLDYYQYNLGWHIMAPIVTGFTVYVFFYQYDKIKAIGSTYINHIKNDKRTRVAKIYKMMMLTIFPIILTLIAWMVYSLYLIFIRSREFILNGVFPTSPSLYLTLPYHPILFWIWHIYHNFLAFGVVIWVLWSNLAFIIFFMITKKDLKFSSLKETIEFSKKLLYEFTFIILVFYIYVILYIGNLFGRGDVLALTTFIGGVLLGMIFYLMILFELKGLISRTKINYLRKIEPNLDRLLNIEKLDSIITGRSEDPALDRQILSTWAVYTLVSNIEEWPISLGQLKNLLKGIIVPLAIYLLKFYLRTYLGLSFI